MWVIKYDNGSYNYKMGFEATLEECTKYNNWTEAKAISSHFHGVISIDPFEHKVSTMNNEELIKQMNAFIEIVYFFPVIFYSIILLVLLFLIWCCLYIAIEDCRK